MKKRESIEKQVAKLTEEQKRKMLKIDLIIGIIETVILLPALAFMCINFFLIARKTFPEEIVRVLATVNFSIMSLAVILIIAILVFVKIKYPYYSGKKCDFIRKSGKDKG